MIDDIRVSTKFKGNRKRTRLSKKLGCEATGFLIDLWITIAQDRPTGELTGWDAQDISLSAGWTGEPQLFLDALLDAKLIDEKNGTYYAHDWAEHQPWIAGTTDRREIARKAGVASSIKRWGNKQNGNRTVTESNSVLKTVTKKSNIPDNTTVTPYHTNTVPIPNPITNIPVKNKYGEFKNVSLSEEEHQKILNSLGEKQTNELIERLSGYIASKGIKYKSHYATMLNWSRKDGEKNGGIDANRQALAGYTKADS